MRIRSPVVLRDADGNWVPLILGAIWLVDKGMAAYDAYQDYKAIQSGEKTVGDVAFERGTGYVVGAIVPGGGLATKLGGKVFKKADDAVGIARKAASKEGENKVYRALREGEDTSAGLRARRFRAKIPILQVISWARKKVT